MRTTASAVEILRNIPDSASLRFSLARAVERRYGYIVFILFNRGVDLLMSQDHRPRSKTRQLMIDIVAGSEHPLSRTEIVNQLNRKKTPHLIDMMEALADAGVFQKDLVIFNNRVTGYKYSMAQAKVRE